MRIVTAEAGGGSDYSARLMAQGLGSTLGQHVVVENRQGGNGVIAIDTAAKAASDGYTMLVYNNSMWILSLIKKKLPYDPVSDFTPVASIISVPNVLVVHPSVQATSTADLIALVKAGSTGLGYASAGIGTTSHISGALFVSMASANLLHVPYKGSASALTGIIGGHVQVMFPNAAAAMPHMKSGKLRALGITSLRPSRLFPELPAVSESGLPSFESVSTFGLFVPAKTPAGVVSQLNQAVAQILGKADVKEKFLNVGAETVGGPPAVLVNTIKTDLRRLAPVIKSAGISED